MDSYSVIKALHIVSFTAWMAGIFYLPRLFVYHTRFDHSETSYALFGTMERKLLRLIMAPAAIATWILGVAMIALRWPSGALPLWMWVKLALVIGMTGYHLLCERWAAAFASRRNAQSERFFRFVNEAPVILLLGIVFLVILEP